MLKESLSDSWSFFKRHVGMLALIILPIVVPVELVVSVYRNFFSGDEEQWIPVFINFIVNPIYSIAVVFYIASIISGEQYDIKSLWGLGIKFWPPYIILSVLVGLLVALGFALLIIPGAFFAVRFAFAEFELLLRQSAPVDAMKASWALTKDYMWILLGGYTVITLATFVPYVFFVYQIGPEDISSSVLVSVIGLALSVLMTLYKIFAFRVYEFAKTKADQPPESLAL